MMIQSAVQQEEYTRSVPRTQLLLSATIRFDSVSAAIRLRDLSASGARFEAAILPAVGSTVHVSRGALHASGTIIWRNRQECGLRFDAPLPLDAWIPPPRARDQSGVDAMIKAIRSGEAQAGAEAGPIHSPPQMPEAFGDALPKRLAEELAYVVRLLESLGDDLCAEPLLVMRHATKLQNLDISAQILGHVAALLVAEQPEQSVDGVGMSCLRKRLQRVSL